MLKIEATSNPYLESILLQSISRHAAKPGWGACCHSFVKRANCFLLVSLALLLTACGRHKPLPPDELNCESKPSIYPLQRIKGGGYLDWRRFYLTTKEEVQKNGGGDKSQCPIDGFSSNFHWTGKKLIPEGYLKPGGWQADWVLIMVRTLLSNQTKAKKCLTQTEIEECKLGPQPPVVTRNQQSEELIVHPLKYPGLEIWLPRQGFQKGTSDLDFVIAGMSRENGEPRYVFCNIFNIYNLEKMSRSDFEMVDLSINKSSCSIEFRDFEFDGGASRVVFSSKLLPQVAQVLPVLQDYLEKSILKED
jgi:hypothetical protein